MTGMYWNGDIRAAELGQTPTGEPGRPSRDQREAWLNLQDKRAHVTFIIARGWTSMSGGPINRADLHGMSRADLIDLILKAEYPEVS